jgi:hypothetical protein
MYKGYTIATETTQVTTGGWALSLGIVDPDGRPVVAGINFGSELIFATRALADRAGVLVGRYWIEGRPKT